MKIVDVEVYLVNIPLKEPFFPVWLHGLPQSSSRLNLVKILTDEGITGITASVAFGEEGRALRGLLPPFLYGRDPFAVEEIIRILRNATYLGLRFWFVEIALWDIIGKVCNQPIYKLLGGAKSKIKAYASTAELRPPEKRCEDVLKLKEMGFKAVKLRLHSIDVKKDLKIVEEVRKAVGDTMDIMADANQAWPVYGLGEFRVWDLNTAVSVAKELENLGVLWLEEPLYKYDYEGLSQLRKKVKIPIAGGEMNSDLNEFRDLIKFGCYDILQPDATISTGILNAKKVAGMCEAYNLKFIPHTWTNGIGLVANLQVMGTAPNCDWAEFPYEPPSWTVEARDAILSEPINIDKDGYVQIPQKPGLGIDLNEGVLRKYAQKI